MKGNIDFVQSGGAEQHLLMFPKQRAVGRQNDLEAMLARKVQIPLQIGMAERFPHQVEIEKIRIGLQLGQERGKLRFCHDLGLALRPGTEAAFQVADIGDFQIYFIESFHSSPVV